MSEQNPFVIGAIGVGQAGANMAQTSSQVLGTKNEYLSVINLSRDDLSQATLVQADRRLHLDEHMFGAGKKRNVSKVVAAEKADQLIAFLKKIYGDKECNLIFIFFSTSGGTGSGVGPFITALFESDALKDAKPARCCIMGVPLIGDLNEGQLLLTNTLSCLREIDVLVKNKRARFLPVYNQSKADIKDDIIKWKSINDDAARLLKRYIITHLTSKYSNLDAEDKFVLLTTPGLHSLLTFNPKDPSAIMTPFIVPEGTSIQKLGCELPAEYSEARFALINSLGANVTEPNFVGLYETGDEDEGDPPIPIAHFAGFNNLANFVQPYQIQVSRLNSVDTIGAKTNKDGTGFDKVEENVNQIAKKNEMAKAKDPSEILQELL
jgi:hypothetical protein